MCDPYVYFMSHTIPYQNISYSNVPYYTIKILLLLWSFGALNSEGPRRAVMAAGVELVQSRLERLRREQVLEAPLEKWGRASTGCLWP